ncbi:MAG: SGNH/GDSL hydrolase family protein [Christensenellaceae bacterium]|jgi:acyl-CoA thioesterase-1
MDAYEKPRRSIAVLGDSVAKGVVLNPEKKKYVFYRQGFIKRLTEKLAASVFDFSKFGTTTSHGSEILQTKVQEINPDIVLIEYGGNDCDYDWDAVAERPDDTHLPKILPGVYEKNIRQMIDGLKKQGKIPVLMNLPPLNAEGYFNWFSHGEAVRKKRILKWLQRVENIYWWQESYSYTVDKIAKLTDTRIIDVRQAFLAMPDYRDYVCGDGIHPNEEGQTLIERIFTRYIEKNAAHILA